MNRLRHGRGRLEYAAIKKAADALFEQGHSYKSAHRLLLEQKKISMSYDTFRRFASGETSLSIATRRAKKQVAKVKPTDDLPALLPVALPACVQPEGNKHEPESGPRLIYSIEREKAFTPNAVLAMGNLLTGTITTPDTPKE